MSETALRVSGLKEFRKGLRAMDRGLPKSIRLTLNSVADIFIAAVRPKIPSRTGAARGSLKAASSQTEARISAGGRKAPYYPWLDFGGKTGRKKSVHRDFYRKGRYVYPTLAEKSDEIQKAMLKGVAQLAANNGIDVD